MRAKYHHHTCSRCQQPFACDADIEQHGEASWEWHCLLYEQDEPTICAACHESNYDGPPDGDAWSGGFARNH
jgi:hypothetical protein